MRSVLAPAPYPEPTSRLNSVTRENSFLRNATKWRRNVIYLLMVIYIDIDDDVFIVEVLILRSPKMK